MTSTSETGQPVLQLTLPPQVRAWCDQQRHQGRTVGFVPTMGYLHRGHVALMERARQETDVVVVSIFVNPTQFGPQEDLATYPRDLPADLEACRQAGVAAVFTPEAEAIYPPGFQTYVETGEVSLGLCGERRPGHFRGVCTVVTKLFNMIGPCQAYFGEKDYQQLQVIKRMALDLDLPVHVHGVPTVREPDGLALSSRNAYLSADQRRAALCLFRALRAMADLVQAQGPLPTPEVLAVGKGIIDQEPCVTLDYLEARDATTLQPCPEVGQKQSVVAVAAFLGKTRLIDNMVI